MITWVMCRPVIEKKVAPNSGTPQGLAPGVTCSCEISRDHSMPCRMTNARPPAMVARIQFPAFLRSPWFIEWTAITIVKLLESRQKVMTLEKMMLGKKSKGFGQSGLETREYV